MTISFSSSGSFKNTEKFLKAMKQQNFKNLLNQVGQNGTKALREATPVDQGVTAASWEFEINTSRTGASVVWTNSHVNNGAPIAILLQYGHGTGTGGWVSGRDYINPATRPVFDEFVDTLWKAVTSA